MSLKKTEAIILRQRHFGNTSLIFTFFTKTQGKMEGLAKGIKKNISLGEGGMEVFSQVELIYYERDPHSLRLLNHCYLLNSFKSLRTTPLRLAYASYLVELVNSLVHGEEKNERIYYLLLKALHFMENEEDINRLVHFFEVKLINILGYGLSSVLNPGTEAIIRFLEKADFQALSRLKISKRDEAQLKTVLQNYIRTLLGNKSLRTFMVIEKIRKNYTQCKSYY